MRSRQRARLTANSIRMPNICHRSIPWHAPSDFHALVRPLPAALQPDVPQFRYTLHDLSARTNAEIKGDVLTRLVQLAMRWIFSQESLEHLERLIALIDQIADRDTALESLESLLRYDQGQTALHMAGAVSLSIHA